MMMVPDDDCGDDGKMTVMMKMKTKVYMHLMRCAEGLKVWRISSDNDGAR